MLAVLKRELKAYFLSPVGYIFMGFFLVISGLFFALLNLLPGSANYIGVLANITFIFLFVVPILTMRLMSEDQRLKTDQLLLTSPLSITGLVLGKYLAAVGVFFLTLVITGLYPLVIKIHGLLAVGEVIGGYIGFLLLGSVFIAIGLFISATTENQVAAAFTTFGCLLLIWFLNWVQQIVPKEAIAGAVFTALLILGVMALVYKAIRNWLVCLIPAVLGVGAVVATYILRQEVFYGLIPAFFARFSLLQRFNSFAMGIFDLSAVIYYLSFSAFFIFLTVRLIEKKRWG
ncbi:MAG: ABC transporter permease [Firmicutes bacterium]|nr:ABC transporter permease [Bacillota bacterium]